MNDIHKRADLNLFRVLDAIERTGGISSAATQLHLTQSAISHSLKRLRLLLDDPLFVRHGQNMVPTSFARSILPSVRKHLVGLNECIESTRTFDPYALECSFHFGFRDPAESLVFPYLLPELAKIAPGVQVVSHPIDRGTLERDLTQGKIDLAVDVAINLPRHIQSQAFHSESAVVLFSARHPLAEVGIDLETYAKARHVMVTEMPSIPGELESFIVDQGIRRNVVLKCQHYFSASQVIAKTDWLMLLPESFAVTMKRLIPVDYCPCPFEVPKVELRMYWHESREHDQGIQWLRSVAVDFVNRQSNR
jgi:DNA-binding transcriptional LysR family regulator